MKQRDVLMLMDGVAPAIASLLGKAMAPMAARLAEVEKQLADAPAQPDVGAMMDAAVAKALADQPKPELVDIDAIARGIEERLTERLAALPKAATAEEIAALIPAPAPGKDADPKVVAALVEKAVAPALEAASAALSKIPTAGEVAALIPTPKDGESVDPATIKAMVNEAVAALPPAKDGASVTLDDVRPVVAEALKAAVDALPKPLDGKSVTAEELRPMVEDAAVRAVAALPVAKDGQDATPEKIAAAVEKVLATWERPKDGERGLPGADGKDGADVAGALIDRDGELVLTLTTGAVKALGVVVGKDGAPGKDGRDGFSLDDFDVVDSPTTFTLRFVQGDHVKERIIPKATMADSFKYGWKEGAEYKRGDLVMWAGQPWLAMADTSARPETNKDWAMFAKKARDGKDGEAPKPLPTLKLK